MQRAGTRNSRSLHSKAKDTRVWCSWVTPTAKHSCTEKEPSLQVLNITLSVISRLLACCMVSPTFRVIVALLLLTDGSTVHRLDLKSICKTVLLLHCILVKFTTKISHHQSLLPREKWREFLDPTWCLGCAHPSSHPGFIEKEALVLPCYIFLLTCLDFLWSKTWFESGLHLGKINNQLP